MVGGEHGRWTVRRSSSLAALALLCGSCLWPGAAVAQAPLQMRAEYSVKIGATQNLQLTADQNLIDLAYEISWSTDDPKRLRARIADPSGLVRVVSIAAMNAIVRRSEFAALLAGPRRVPQEAARRAVQQALDGYGAGIRILRVALLRAEPPRAVLRDFRGVQAAEQDGERRRQEAERDAQSAIVKARRTAKTLLNEAEEIHAEHLEAARSEAARFRALAKGYREAPDEASRRFYLEALRLIPE